MDFMEKRMSRLRINTASNFNYENNKEVSKEDLINGPHWLDGLVHKWEKVS